MRRRKVLRRSCQGGGAPIGASRTIGVAMIAS